MSAKSLIVDPSVRKRLGRRGLADVRAQLWPVACQTCGRPFDQESPTLVVDDLGVGAWASVHHRGCRVSGWNHELTVDPTDELLSRFAVMLMTPIRRRNEVVEEPMLLVNPGLEQVRLRPVSSGWRVGTVENVVGEVIGMGLLDWRPCQPMPNARAVLRDHMVVIECGPELWGAPIGTQEAETRIVQGEGLNVAVTTAVHPGELNKKELFRAARRDQVAAGWVRLDPPGDTDSL